MRLFKLLESNNGWVCSDTEWNFKHRAIAEGSFLVSSKYFPEKGLYLDQRHTNILLFQRSFLIADSEVHHQCLLAFKAPASDYPETQAVPCRHKCRLWVMVLHVLQHRTWNWAGERGSKTSHKHRAYILELGFYTKGWSSLIPAIPVLISGQLVSQTAFSSFFGVVFQTPKWIAVAFILGILFKYMTGTEKMFALKFFAYFHLTIAGECTFHLWTAMCSTMFF